MSDKALRPLKEAKAERHSLSTPRTHAQAFESDKEAQKEIVDTYRGWRQSGKSPEERQKVSWGGGTTDENRLLSFAHQALTSKRTTDRWSSVSTGCVLGESSPPWASV